ncbi:MAG: chloride channel protein [Solidesulfovibrio sp. DCME]|uniref:chloride channel protein n=1 Tax=Solidesulfovibrio sp. DCME TaxID=3447380 RepID=UPI003D09C9A0
MGKPTSPPRAGQASGSPLHRLGGVVVLTGLVAGVGGMGLALLLHAVQHLAFGYEIGHWHGTVSFLQGVAGASPERRVLALGVCGLVAGLGWWGLRRYCRPLVSIAQAVAADDHRMPVFATTAHTLLQIVTVGLGSPLGREVAPREFAAVYAGRLAGLAGLTGEETRVIVACAAGAGLAAVYNVPVGGALFTLEALLCTYRFSAVIPALATAGIASMVAWLGLGDVWQYQFPPLAISASLVGWSVAAGPLLGAVAFGFSRAAAAARESAPRDRRLIPLCLVNFLGLGLLSIPFPELLGNGRGPIQLSLENELGTGLAAALFALKLGVVVASLRAGAAGGLLTPGMTLGAMLATVTAGAWNAVFPPLAPAAFAIIGAGAFLAASMRMPLAAIVLTFEFTRFDHDFFYPLVFAVVGAYGTCVWLSGRAGQPVPAGH